MADFQYQVVTWSGDAVSGRTIPTDFPLDTGVVAVFVGRVNAEVSVLMRISTHAANFCAKYGFDAGASNGILNFTASGFTVGNGTEANASGGTYVALVLRDNSSDNRYMRVGSYVGNSTDNRAITITAFTPILVWTFGRDWCMRTEDLVGDDSFGLCPITGVNKGANIIQSFDTNGFTVGNAANINQSSINYHWLALKFTVAERASLGFKMFKAAGTAGNPDQVTGLVFTPSFAVARRYQSTTTNNNSYYKGPTHAAANSSEFDATAGGTTNGIEAFGSGTIDLGSTLAQAGDDIYGFAFAGSGSLGQEVTIPREGFIGLTWIELFDAQNNYEVWAKIALPDPATYYHGFKQDRITQWGSIRRALSDRMGNYEGSEFTWVASDTDGSIRTKLANTLTQYFSKMPVTVRMIDDPSRRLLATPRTMFKGIIKEYRPLQNRLFDFHAIDPLTKKFNMQNGLKLPQRTITLTDFPHANDTLPNQAAGTARTVGAVGKGVPIIYGEVSDKNLTTEVRPIPNVLPIDSTLAIPDNQHATDVAGAGNLDGWVTARVKQVKNGMESPLGPMTAATNWEDRAVRFYWNKVTGADSYRIYISEHGGWDPHGPRDAWGIPVTYGRLLTHDNSTLDGDNPDGMSVLFTAWTDGTDVFTSTNETVTVDRGKGLVKPIYVGDYTINGTVYKGALLCGHAVKSLVSAYVNDRPIDLASDPNFLTPNNAAAWAAAGFTTSYTDINSRRYMLVYLKGDPGEMLAGTISPQAGSPGVTFNVQGIETVGDGTGTLITDLHQQYKHLLVNWLFQSYQGGAWLSTPVFADETSLEQIDTASFDNCTTIAGQRITGGYPGAFIIGVDGELKSPRDVIAMMNISADTDSGFDRKSRYMVSMETETVAALNNATILTDVADILEGSFEIEDRLDEHFNVVNFVYNRDWSGRSEWASKGQYKDSQSITNYGEEKVSPEIELWALRSQAASEDIAQRRLRRTKNPPRYVTFKVGLQGLNHELGDIVRISHFDGIGSTVAGWVKQPVRITRHELDADGYTVTIEAYDMGPLFATAYIFGDETALAASWASASVLDRYYGYLGDETTEKFSDNAPIKRMV